MKKNLMSRTWAIVLGAIVSFLLIGITMALWDVPLIGDDDGAHLSFGAFHVIISSLTIGITAVFTICVIADLVMSDEDKGPLSFLYKNYEPRSERTEREEKDTPKKQINFKKIIWWIVAIVAAFYLFGFLKSIVIDCKNVYNKSKMYHNTYTQKVEEKKGFYDKLWKTYLQKEKITNVNKETFIQVTKIIMENRKDGEKVTWKWIQENQQIPYDEFTKFYADLSNFITSQREGYFNIEKECQVLANQNNTLLDTFPNNFYNKILKCERIKFEYGITSDSTENVFTKKKENLK